MNSGKGQNIWAEKLCFLLNCGANIWFSALFISLIRQQEPTDHVLKASVEFRDMHPLNSCLFRFEWMNVFCIHKGSFVFPSAKMMEKTSVMKCHALIQVHPYIRSVFLGNVLNNWLVSVSWVSFSPLRQSGLGSKQQHQLSGLYGFY